MHRLAPVLAGLALAGAAPVAALAPAPEVAVLVHAPSNAASPYDEALLARIAPADGSGWLRRAEPAFTSADFEGCGATGVDPEACVRGVLTARGAARMDGPPTVVVLIRPAPGFHVGWTCIGVGDGPSREDRQRRPGIERTPGAEDRNAQAAAGCILAAAAESGW
ncbi:MAG: hypothetical protein HYU62_07805 [Caulobacterales bacterium]|nr:hypothetical protein [Caulobacterales bacterium]